MRNLKFYITALFAFILMQLFAQVQIDRPLQLTGSGSNAKISGIKSVTDSLDAASAQAVQNGGMIYAPSSGSSNNFIISITPPVSAYQVGMVFNFISNQTVNGPATLNVNNLGSDAITKYVDEPLAGCEIYTGQAVSVLFDGTNFQMISVLHPTTPAGVPVAIAGMGAGQTQITANWDSSANATGYYLDVATDAGFVNLVPGYNNLNVGNVLSYNVTGISCGTTYYYRVRSSNNCTSGSGNSNTDSLSTIACCTDGTGGSITHYTDGSNVQWTVHTFLLAQSGQAFTPPACVSSVEALAVAGGGGGGTTRGGGGGGAGGLIYNSSYAVSNQSYTITVGSGGAGGSGTVRSNSGTNSVFATLTAIGGGGGAGVDGGDVGGESGGSGGGADHDSNDGNGGTGTPGQGNNGANTGCNDGSERFTGSGGGGAGAAGIGGTCSGAGSGGTGLAYSISGNSTYYAGGGGGGTQDAGNNGLTAGTGGTGGGGNGGLNASASPGVNNTGGGGGGGGNFNNGGNGGSGIVIISYPTP